jgi:hypothetical protein
MVLLGLVVGALLTGCSDSGTSSTPAATNAPAASGTNAAK